MRDFYDVLGISRNAGLAEIKSAYRAIALATHPDKTGNDADASARFTEATQAFETLSDDNKRRLYDRGYVTIGSLRDLYFRHEVGLKVMEKMLPVAPAAPERGADLLLVRSVTPELLITGGSMPIEITDPTTGNAREEIMIVPPDSANRPWCRMVGLGVPGKNGAPAGDLLVYLVSRKA